MAYLEKWDREYFRQKSLALLHSETAFHHYYLLDITRSDFKMLVTGDYKEQWKWKSNPPTMKELVLNPTRV